MAEFPNELYNDHTQERRTMVQRVESLSAIAATASRLAQASDQRCDTLERAFDSTLDRIPNRVSTCQASWVARSGHLMGV